MDGADERGYRVYRAAAILALVLALITLGVLAGTQQRPSHTTCFDVPLVPAQSLQICMWQVTGAPNHDAGPYYPMMGVALPVRRVGLWYQPGAGQLPTYLMAFQLPIWPLSALTTCAGLLAWGLDLRRRGKCKGGR